MPSPLSKSKSALGAFGRRLRARLDAAKAIKAVAHKLARIVYRMLKYGQEFTMPANVITKTNTSTTSSAAFTNKLPILVSNSFPNSLP